jgi:nucleoside-diphosphate-sugar epimerase
MRIVVNGGRGFIGSAVVHRLLEIGAHEVVVTTRDPGARDPFNGRVRFERVSVGELSNLARVFESTEVVIHAVQFAGHPVEKPSRGRTYFEVDGRGTSAAVTAAQRSGVRRVVYISGAGAGRGLDQTWFRAKDMAEAAIRKSGLEYAIVRPSWIYGRGDRSMTRLIRICRSFPVVPIIGNGVTPAWPADVRDIARAVADLAQRPDAAGRTLELGGPERLTMDAVIRAIQDLIDKRRPLLHVPATLARNLSRLISWLPAPPLSPGAVDFVTQSVEIDPRPAFDFLGFAFRPLALGLREHFASPRASGYARR